MVPIGWSGEAHRTVPLDGAEGHIQYYPESKGSRQGASGWARNLVQTESLSRFRRLVRNIPPGEGLSDSAGQTNRSSGVWRLNLLLGDLGRYHSFPGKGEAETTEV